MPYNYRWFTCSRPDCAARFYQVIAPEHCRQRCVELPDLPPRQAVMRGRWQGVREVAR
jgi:hypothetical protein